MKNIYFAVLAVLFFSIGSLNAQDAKPVEPSAEVKALQSQVATLNGELAKLKAAQQRPVVDEAKETFTTARNNFKPACDAIHGHLTLSFTSGTLTVSCTIK